MLDFLKLSTPAILAVLLTSCASIDNVESRTTTMNLNISEAENKGILLNLARASLSEPLSFSALANYTGHQTLGTTVGLPNLGFVGNPLTLASLQTAGTAANGSLSNDFAYVGSDDNATYAALLQPIDPTTLGYFLRQEYPRELLFFLVVSKIRTSRGGRREEYVNAGTTREEVDRGGVNEFARFGTKLQSLIDSGLTAQIDVATGSRSRLCFDRDIRPIYPDEGEVRSGLYEPTCAKAPIYETRVPGKDDKKNESAAKPFSDSYRFHDARTGEEVELFFRSPFGIYRYLGVLIAKRNKVPIVRDPESRRDEVIVTVVERESDCFVSQAYRGRTYCVPSEATTTKRVFALLHDIVKLYTFPTATPQTISARLVPGGG